MSTKKNRAVKGGVNRGVDALLNIDFNEMYTRMWPKIERKIRGVESAATKDNPLVLTTNNFFSSCAESARRFATDRLASLLMRLSEHRDLHAYCASLYLFNATTGQLSLTAGRNLPQGFHVLEANEISIVSHVATSREPYWCPDVLKDKYYRPCLPKTRSEIAVPFVDHAGVLLGVINFESHRVCAYNEATLRTIQKYLGLFRIHMKVLHSLHVHPNKCPWHPELHGWIFQKIMEKLCKSVTETLGVGTSTCTAWYCDRDKQTAFAYATCGYDFVHLYKETLPLHLSKVGLVLQGEAMTTVSFSPADDPEFFHRQKAKDMDINEGHMIRVPAFHRHGMGNCVLAFYTRDLGSESLNAERRRVIREGLPVIASTIHRMASQFVKERGSYAVNLVRDEVQRSGADVFLKSLSQIICIMRADAGSFFGAVPGSDTLECLATTGFLVNDDCPAEEASATCQYSISQNPESYTVLSALHPGEPIRMNDTTDSVEQGRPQWVGSQSKPTAWLREAVRGAVPKRRRLIMIGFRAPDGSMGVLRLIRSAKRSPFVKCDEELITKISEELRIGLALWSHAKASNLPFERPKNQLVSQPSQRSRPQRDR